MTEHPNLDVVTAFYDNHPINEQQILERLANDDVDLTQLNEDILQNYDQDHYDGVAANDVLADLAAIDKNCHVLDVCCGMGGPSRYLAHNYGCQVTGIDLTQSRIDGATRLTDMAGLDDRVTFRCANALDMPFDDQTFDVVISQEAFCHIPDKDQLIAQCVRVLKPGGRLAFTDILKTGSTTQAALERLNRDLAYNQLGSLDSYRQRLTDRGCAAIKVEDLSQTWRTILVDRLAMYRGLKDQTVARFGLEHFDNWDKAYSYFVGLYETGELGGGRFAATRGPA